MYGTERHQRVSHCHSDVLDASSTSMMNKKALFVSLKSITEQPISKQTDRPTHTLLDAKNEMFLFQPAEILLSRRRTSVQSLESQDVMKHIN